MRTLFRGRLPGLGEHRLSLGLVFAIFFLGGLSSCAAFASDISYYGKTVTGDTVLAHPFFQIPRVSEPFCLEYLSRTASMVILGAGLKTLQEIRASGQSSSPPDCFERIDAEGRNAWGGVDFSPEHPPPKPKAVSKQDEIFHYWLYGDWNGAFVWALNEKTYDYKIVSLCGPRCLEIQRLDPSWPSTEPFKMEAKAHERVPRDTSEYSAFVGKQVNFSEQIKKLYDVYIPFEAGTRKAEDHYVRRRLTSRFLAYLRNGGEPKDLQGFCRIYRKEQDRDENFARHFSSHRFFTKPEWDLAQKRGLTESEAYSLYMYTNAWAKRINQEIRSGAPLQRESRVFHEELLAALGKLEPYRGLVKRWTNIPPEVEAGYAKGKTIDFGAYTSTSRNNWLAGTKPAKILIYSGREGKYVGPFNTFRGEEEVVFAPGAKFRVLDVLSIPTPYSTYDLKTKSVIPQVHKAYVLGEVDGKGNLVTGKSYRLRRIRDNEECEEAACRCGDGSIVLYGQGPSEKGTCR